MREPRLPARGPSPPQGPCPALWESPSSHTPTFMEGRVMGPQRSPGVFTKGPHSSVTTPQGSRRGWEHRRGGDGTQEKTQPVPSVDPSLV